jgi:N-acetylglucosaminyldiphosphoundecaprenol N-acetyl-beta-D-mannosaminyltransferase
MLSAPLVDLIGTPLLVTDYDTLRSDLLTASRAGKTMCVDFSNTHIVTARRHDPAFRATTACFDAFVPDGMPLVWCMNARGAKLKDRIYGPTFTRRFLASSPREVRHYFLGGSVVCLEKMIKNMRALNPDLQVAGTQHGYFRPNDEPAIVSAVAEAGADFLWVGLGTPKQQEWIDRNRACFPGLIILAVGFAFDVNAGLKKDAPIWMQRIGLTWLFRMLSEPRRLFGRYVYFNSLFIYYLLRDSLLPSFWSRK